MKQIFIFLLILSTMIFIGCTNDITDSNSSSQGDGGNNNDYITKPDGLASTYDGTWYFYSEDGTIKGDTITIANGGITGLKTSSGTAIEFVKDNFNSKVVFDINPIASKNYVVYKDGYTGNINLNTDIAYIKIKDLSGTIIEGMLSKAQRSTTIDTTHVGTYTYTSSSTGAQYELEVTTDLVSFTRTSSTSSGTPQTYTMPAAYFTKTENSYTCDALNYPETVLDFDNMQFTIKYIDVNYSASDANFSEGNYSSFSTTLSDSTFEYTKQP